MCVKVPRNVTDLKMYWNGFTDALLLFFAVDPREPYIKQTKADGELMTYELSAQVENQFFRFTRMDVIHLYSDFRSNFTGFYPPEVIESSIVYRETHCIDVANILAMNDSTPCKENQWRSPKYVNRHFNE